MNKIVLAILVVFQSVGLTAIIKNDLEYHKDSRHKITDRIASGVGGTLGSPGLLITIPAFMIVNALLAKVARHEFNLAHPKVYGAILSPVYGGAKLGRKVARPLVINLLMSKHQLSPKAVNLAIDYGLTLDIYRDLLFAAQTRDTANVKKFLHKELYLLFGAQWPDRFAQMFNDFKALLAIKFDSDRSVNERNQAMGQSSFLLNYNQMERDLFLLMLRVFMAVHQLYYNSDLTLSKKSKIDFEDEYYIIFNHEGWLGSMRSFDQGWLIPLQDIINLIMPPMPPDKK